MNPDSEVREIVSLKFPTVAEGTETWSDYYDHYKSMEPSAFKQALTEARGVARGDPQPSAAPMPSAGDSGSPLATAPSASEIPGYSKTFVPEVGAYLYTEMTPPYGASPKTQWRTAVKPPVDKSRSLNLPPVDLSQSGEYNQQMSQAYANTESPDQLADAGLEPGPIEGTFIKRNSGVPGKALFIDQKNGTSQFIDLPGTGAASTPKLNALQEFTQQFGEPTPDELAYMRAKQAGIPIRQPSQPVDKSPTDYQSWQMGKYPEETAYSRGQDTQKRQDALDKQAAADQQFQSQEARIVEQAKLQQEQSRLIERSRLQQELGRLSTQASMKAIPPSLVGGYVPGFEPGGPMQAGYRELGLTGFTPQKITGVRPDVSGIEQALAELAGGK